MQLLEEAPGPAGSFRFAHGLIRETLYGDLSATRRARLHGAVGEALERTAASEAELAHHFIEAAAVGDRPRRSTTPSAPATRRWRALAYERAADLFDAALPPSTCCPSPTSSGAASCCSRAARRRCTRAGTPRVDAAGRHRARPARRRQRPARPRGAQPRRLRPLPRHRRRRARRPCSRRRCAGLSPDGSALRARLLVRLAVAIYYSEAAQRREELVDEALGIARGLDDPPTLAFVLDQGQIATNGPDTTERGLAWAHELFALADTPATTSSAVRARSCADRPAARARRPAGADMAIETLDRIATDSRDPRARAYIPLHRARRAMMAGRLEDAERLIDEGIKLGWSLQDSTVPILAGAQLFWLRLGQGRLGELENAVHQFADQLPAMPAWRVALAMLYLHAGRAAEARREYEHLAARGFATSRATTCGRWPWRARRALRGLPRRRARGRARGAARALRGRNVVTPRASSPGPVTRYLALTAAARGDQDAALDHMAAARDGVRAAGLGPMLALLDVDEARMLARRDGPGDAEARPRAPRSAGSTARRRSASRASTSGWRAPRRCCPRRGRRPRPRPPSRPRGRGPPRCCAARATCGASSTRAARCSSRTPRACATSRCCSTTRASSSTRSTSPARPRAAPRRGRAERRGARRAGRHAATPARRC